MAPSSSSWRQLFPITPQMTPDRNSIPDVKSIDCLDDAVATADQKEQASEKKDKQKKTKRKKRKKSLRPRSADEKSDVSALTHETTTTTTSRVSAASTPAGAVLTTSGEISTTSASPKASSVPALPVFESSPAPIDTITAPALLRNDSTGCGSSVAQGVLQSTAGSSDGARQLPEEPSRTGGERQPSDASRVAMSSGGLLPGRQSTSRHWGGSLFDLSPSTRIDDTTTVVLGSRTKGMFHLFGRWAQPLLPQHTGTASSTAFQQNQFHQGTAPTDGGSGAPPQPSAALQTDGRDPSRAAPQGRPASGADGAGRGRTWNSREMGYSYFTTDPESKKPKSVGSLPGLGSVPDIYRLPDSTATSPRSKAAWCETTMVAAAFCIFWAVFAIIVLLMRERLVASDDNGDPLCQTDDCVLHAALLANITATSTVGPCEDFAAYVCSVWSPANRPPTNDSHQESSAMDAVIYDWYKGVGDALRAGASQLPIGVKAVEMYDACVGDDSRYGTNPDEFLRFVKEVGLGWPEALPEGVDALSVFVSLAFNFEAPAWFSVDISESRDRKLWRLVISPDGYLPVLLDQHRDIVKTGGYVSHWSRIWNSIAPSVAQPGKDELESERRVMEDILGKLQGAASSPSKDTALFSLGDIGKYTHPVSSSNWVEALNKTLPVPVTTATEVYFPDVSYMKTVGILFSKYDDRQLVRHLSWLFVQLYGPAADPRLLVNRSSSDEPANAPRLLFCGSNVVVSYKLLLSMLYFVSRISVQDRNLLDACFESLIVTGAEKVANSSWLDVDSKLLAGAKIKAVEARIWPNEVLVKTNFLEQIYEEFPKGRDSFAAYWVQSRRKIRNLKARKLYRRLSYQPRCSREQCVSYDATLNHVLVAIGALVRPLFYRNGTKGMLYGGIGFLMALEIVKSLDSGGLRWGPSGNVVADSILSKPSQKEYAKPPPIEKDGDYETAAISWSDSRALHVENRRTAPLARRKILSLVDSVTCLCIAACRFVSFFAFPKDPLLKKRWLVAIKRDEGKLFAVTKHTKVRSTHFANDDCLPNVVGGRRYLRVDAVPSVFAFGKPQRPARRKPRDRQQCVSRASELALETTLPPGGDVAVSRDCATADGVLDATECSDSASAPTSATDFQERQEVCGCAATVVNLEEQLSEHQANWKAI
ncbi:hypothetical protein HPB50_025621 [Hyalomma asiaticum]|uniref:Uncharacterized protein n=1 Tax=Hyalomma asiaticum TaxID=266040 RepID=A0ACB7SKN3_HYAAI|nr:hypothetical protein HPB50_025621 [Hyalomma asiaticum]